MEKTGPKKESREVGRFETTVRIISTKTTNDKNNAYEVSLEFDVNGVTISYSAMCATSTDRIDSFGRKIKQFPVHDAMRKFHESENMSVDDLCRLSETYNKEYNK